MRLAILAAILLAAGCDGSSSDQVPSRIIAGWTYQDIPSSFDACADGDGGVLAVWVDPGKGVDGRQTLYLCRFDGNKRRWDRPRVLVGGGIGFDGVRLASRGPEIHVVYSNRLRHLSSRDGGGTWRAEPPLLSDSTWIAKACGLAVRGPGVLEAIVLRQPWGNPLGNEKGGPLVVDHVETSDGLPGPMTTIGRFENSRLSQPDPVLVEGSVGMEAYFAINRVHSPRPRSITGVGFVLRSTCTGPTTSNWTPAEGITAEAPPVAGLGFARSRGQRAIFYQAGTRFVVVEKPEGGWAEPRQVADTRSFQPTYPAISLLFDSQNGTGRMAWIDCGRAVEPWKRFLPFTLPLAILPIRDWDNNDLAISRVTMESGSVIVGPPARLTNKLAYVRDLRLVSTGGRSFAVWIGKTKIGETIESGRHPVSLFAQALD